MQPIIRGIQAVGGVDLCYRYNGPQGIMKVPADIVIPGGDGSPIKYINTSAGLKIAGFRLDGEFVRANPQLASSFVIPILGGGGVALTNNNRTGSVTFNCTRVSSPNIGDDKDALKMYSPEGSGIGVSDVATGQPIAAYDLVLLAQIQQAQVGGDSAGATIDIQFEFNSVLTSVSFQGCTVASVDPLGLSGNDAVNYNVVFNYLNWKLTHAAKDAEGNNYVLPWFTETTNDAGGSEYTATDSDAVTSK